MAQTIEVVDTTPPEITGAFVKVGEERYRINYSASDNCDAEPTIKRAFIKACGRKHSVANGQVIEYEYEADDDCEVEWDDGVLEIEGKIKFLKIVAKDDCGNKGKLKVSPPVTGDDDDD